MSSIDWSRVYLFACASTLLQLLQGFREAAYMCLRLVLRSHTPKMTQDSNKDHQQCSGWGPLLTKPLATPAVKRTSPQRHRFASDARSGLTQMMRHTSEDVSHSRKNPVGAACAVFAVSLFASWNENNQPPVSCRRNSTTLVLSDVLPYNEHKQVNEVATKVLPARAS
jgi:hypothetical protein